jgi:predicted anti-sigma-YlaC factor YlaD
MMFLIRHFRRLAEGRLESLVRRAAGSLLVFSVFLTGCSMKTVALRAVADELSSSTGGGFTEDNDLEFVGDSLPFALKLMESINQGVPDHVDMKLALASGFTQYGVVYVEWPAAQHRFDDFPTYRAGLQRARRFYERANGYAQIGLELKHPGFREHVFGDTERVLSEMTKEDVPFLYWTAASWLATATADLEDPESVGLIPVAAACLKRAYELDADWDSGSIRELMISLEPTLPEPGGELRAEVEYARVVELSKGARAGPHVALATAVALPAQDRARFVALLDKALAVDLDAHPESRLANDYAQQKAAFLLAHLDDLFLE